MAGQNEPKQSPEGRATLKRIFARIDALGLSQAEAASRAGLAASRLSKWAAGIGEPTATHLLKLSSALGMPASAFLGEVAPSAAKAHEMPQRVKLLLDLVGERRDQVSPDEALGILFRTIQGRLLPPGDEGDAPRDGRDDDPIGPRRRGPKPRR